MWRNLWDQLVDGTSLVFDPSGRNRSQCLLLICRYRCSVVKLVICTMSEVLHIQTHLAVIFSIVLISIFLLQSFRYLQIHAQLVGY